MPGKQYSCCTAKIKAKGVGMLAPQNTAAEKMGFLRKAGCGIELNCMLSDVSSSFHFSGSRQSEQYS
jgi:hypothetical protein